MNCHFYLGSNYSAIEVTVQNIEPNRHTLTHSEGNIMFQALMYGRADRESYALPLGKLLLISTYRLCDKTAETNMLSQVSLDFAINVT